jgi:hypothetical protein
MEENMMGNIKKIKKKDMEYLNGLMGKFIKDNGKMVNKMEKENFVFPLIKMEKVYGIRVKELNRLKIQMIIFKMLILY